MTVCLDDLVRSCGGGGEENCVDLGVLGSEKSRSEDSVVKDENVVVVLTLDRIQGAT